MPDWFHPGPAGYQRYNALQYDPYPLDDVGPDVTSTRPPEYSQPIPSAKWTQRYSPRPAAVRPPPWATWSMPDFSNLVSQPAGVVAPSTPVAPSLPAYQVRPPY